MFDIVINMNTSFKYGLTLAKFIIWQPLQALPTCCDVGQSWQNVCWADLYDDDGESKTFWKVSCDVTVECTEPSRIAYLLPFGARQQATEQICIATQPIFILLQSVSSSRRPGETAWLMAVGWVSGQKSDGTAPGSAGHSLSDLFVASWHRNC